MLGYWIGRTIKLPFFINISLLHTQHRGGVGRWSLVVGHIQAREDLKAEKHYRMGWYKHGHNDTPENSQSAYSPALIVLSFVCPYH